MFTKIIVVELKFDPAVPPAAIPAKRIHLKQF
jgi:hypothetical protein